jgi:hypothetical protein
VTRLLEGATDDLYEPGSDACHLALRQLWDVFDHLGFKVVKKSANETTLRVYPERMHQYPLLNPRFEAHAEDWGTDFDGDCLVITALAKEPDPVLNEHLKTFNHDEGTFIFDGESAGGYYIVGCFIIPVHFTETVESAAIDFVRLGGALAAILRHLRRPPLARESGNGSITA